LPLAKPIIAVIAISTFLGSWNDFMWPWMIAQKQDLWTLNVALYNLSSSNVVKPNLIMGVSAVTILPVILITTIFSEQIKQSIASSGIRG
jgi:ABC-type glycerol-3-phosphate transport system permease component